MADKFTLDIVTPARLLLSEEVEEMTGPGAEGEFGILAGHAPYLTLLKAGTMTYKSGGASRRIVVGRGYAEISHDRTTVLVEQADFEDEIDAGEAREALKKAEERLASLTTEDAGYEAAKEAVELAEARVNIKGA